jgi:hypothetical protein
VSVKATSRERNCLWMAAWHKFDSLCCAIAYDP